MFWLNIIAHALLLATVSVAADPDSTCPEVGDECPNDNINFYLYNRYTEKQPYKLDVTSNEESIKNAHFVRNGSIKVLVHGYTGHLNYTPNLEIRPVYLEYPDINVISVDYGNLVKSPCYLQAVKNVPGVAKCIAQFLSLLLKLRPDIKLEQIHIIGMSLGAHISGMIHQFFDGGPFTRLTGLDPALPLFSPFPLRISKSQIDKDSAEFVDIVHTNCALKGQLKPRGHVDFYANYGTFQPGCGYNTSCSHRRAAEYYAESIFSDVGFWSQPCQDMFSFYFRRCEPANEEDLILMGEYVPRSARGIYFFETNDAPLFARGKYTVLPNKQ